MKRFAKIAACLCLGVCLFCGCAAREESPPETNEERQSIDPATLSDYLAPVTYRGRTVTMKSESASRGEAVWQSILSDAQVLAYPEEQVSYYETQLRAEVRYLAEREDMSYEDMLTLRGLSEEKITEEARRLVKSDLVLLYIVTDGGIALTEADKTAHFDRYAQKYAEDYGYERAYAEEHLRDEIYESMLFDKTMEYLILHNSFTVGG